MTPVVEVAGVFCQSIPVAREVSKLGGPIRRRQCVLEDGSGQGTVCSPHTVGRLAKAPVDSCSRTDHDGDRLSVAGCICRRLDMAQEGQGRDCACGRVDMVATQNKHRGRNQ